MGDSPDNRFFRQLMLGRPGAAARIAALARRVVCDRGYYIPAADRPDVVQEVVLDVWRAVLRPQFRYGKDFDHFVRTIAYRRCVDWLRRRRPTEELTSNPGPGGSRPDEHLFTKERLEQGRQVLAALKESCRELFRLRAVAELSYRDIAERQQRTEGAVRNQMYKCLQEARRILGRIEQDRG